MISGVGRHGERGALGARCPPSPRCRGPRATAVAISWPLARARGPMTNDEEEERKAFHVATQFTPKRTSETRGGRGGGGEMKRLTRRFKKGACRPALSLVYTPWRETEQEEKIKT